MQTSVEHHHKSDGKKVLLVGCGELGSRHLQAIASIPCLREIEIVEPRMAGRVLGQKRLKEISDYCPSTRIRWLDSLEKASIGGDVCIIATQADVRESLLRQISEAKDYSAFLLEKVVSCSVKDYENLIAFSVERDLSVWVNCKSRAHFSHKRAKQNIDQQEPCSLTVFGGNHGLATNGIHFADLFSFYDETGLIYLDQSIIDPILHASKRGGDVFDLSGHLQGHSIKGSQLKITLSANHSGPAFFTIKSKDYSAAIDDETGCFYESRGSKGQNWKRVRYDDDIYVSHLSRQFVSDILESGKCELPTLEECFPAHRFILGALLPHFNKLLGVEGDRCPVT